MDPMVISPGSLPLLWFGLYRDVTTLPAPHLSDTAPYAVSPWRPTLSKEAYWEAIARIKAYIENKRAELSELQERARIELEGQK